MDLPRFSPERLRGYIAAVRHDGELRARCRWMKLAHCPHENIPMAVRPCDTWYVSFEPIKLPTGKRAFSRATETFRSELEAKDFARQKLTEAQNVSAGTLNPHLPNRVISTAQIIQWREEPSDRDAAP